MIPNCHARSDTRSVHLHTAALDKLERCPERKPEVLALLERWLDDERLAASRRWLEDWREMLLNWSPERMRTLVLSEGGQSLRQCSPLAPVLTPRERWRAFREAERAFEAGRSRKS